VVIFRAARLGRSSGRTLNAVFAATICFDQTSGVAVAFCVSLQNVKCWNTGRGSAALADCVTRGVAAGMERTAPIDLEQPDPQNWVRVGPYLVKIFVDRISITRDGRPIYHVRTEGGRALPVGGDVEHGQWFYWTLPCVVSSNGKYEKGPFRGHFDLVW